MVSVVIVGPSISGKTTLCHQLAGYTPPTNHTVTLSCYYLTAMVNNLEWHVWDTPALPETGDTDAGWPGEDVLQEANIVLVCHDGRYANPMNIVDKCGRDRCIIVFTKENGAELDLSYFLTYLQGTACFGLQLVPREKHIYNIIARIISMLSC